MRVLRESHDIVSKPMSSGSSMKPFSGKQYICRQFNTGNSLQSTNIGGKYKSFDDVKNRVRKQKR